MSDQQNAVIRWIPIESAPKDGTSIIGGCFDEYGNLSICLVWWEDEFDAFISSCRVTTMAPGWTVNGKTRELHSPEIENPTHWIPMPVEAEYTE